MEEISADLGTRNIAMLDYGGTTNDQSEFRCMSLGCGRVWWSRLGRVRRGEGCPSCAAAGPYRRLRLAEVAADLAQRGIALVSPYPGSVDKRAQFRCIECGHEWEARYTHIRSSGTGCPKCAVRGFNRVAPAWLYLIVNRRLGAAKIGVTSTEAQEDRLARHRLHGWEEVWRRLYPSGSAAEEAERTVLSMWAADGLPVPFVAPADMPRGGSYETTSLALLDLDAFVVDYLQVGEF